VEDEIAEVVREHGWFAASIFDHDAPFLYSIGLMQTCGHPELVVFGLEASDAHVLLSGMVREIRAGRSYAQSGIYTVRQVWATVSDWKMRLIDWPVSGRSRRWKWLDMRQ
jgi:hypothetical protein